MSALTLVIDTVPPIALGPEILDVSGSRIGGGGLSPTLTLALDPGDGALARALDPPPLRVRALLSRPDGHTFTGIIQAVRLGADPSITLES